jgi:hypothetical protein
MCAFLPATCCASQRTQVCAVCTFPVSLGARVQRYTRRFWRMMTLPSTLSRSCPNSLPTTLSSCSRPRQVVCNHSALSARRSTRRLRSRPSSSTPPPIFLPLSVLYVSSFCHHVMPSCHASPVLLPQGACSVEQLPNLANVKNLVVIDRGTLCHVSPCLLCDTLLRLSMVANCSRCDCFHTALWLYLATNEEVPAERHSCVAFFHEL